MSSSEEQQRQELITSFTSVTGVEGERARFYLEAAGWGLEAALSGFYEDSESATPPPVAAPAKEPMPQQPPRAQQQEPGLVTMDTIRSANAPQSDDQQAFYAGGSQSSGQQVLGPSESKKAGLVEEMFRRAREHGAEEVAPQDSTRLTRPPSGFQGAGYKLGDSTGSELVKPAGSVEEPPHRVVLRLWSQGFTLDGGPLRYYNDPANGQFLEAVKRGELPPELLHAGREVDVTMEDHHHEEYVPPRVTVRPFQGVGNVLGSPSTVAPAPTSDSDRATDEARARAALNLDESQPTTSLQLRFVDGTRVVLRVNHSHTVGDVYAFVNSARPHYASTNYVLTLFPNRELAEMGETIAAAGLLNSSLVMKMK